MSMILPKSVLQELEKFSKLRHLECDGMTRVASYTLAQAGVAHEACTGYVTLIDVPRWVKTRTITHHFWLEFESGGETFVIDYRARMWLVDKPFVAHGVFPKSKFPKTVYSEKGRGRMDVSPLIFEVLTRPVGAPV